MKREVLAGLVGSRATAAEAHEAIAAGLLVWRGGGPSDLLPAYWALTPKGEAALGVAASDREMSADARRQHYDAQDAASREHTANVLAKKPKGRRAA